MNRPLAGAAALLLGATAVSAAPSVFVRGESGGNWWSGRMEARILGRSAGSVTVEQLSAHIEATMIFYPYAVCALEAVQADTYVGLDRDTQAQIAETLPHVCWRHEASAPDGRRTTAQSVVFEGCSPDDPRGAALLVTDSATGEILRWLPLDGQIDAVGQNLPAWTLFLFPREGDELFSYSGCTECGARTYVYYDVTRRRIYTEYNGH